MQSIRRGSWRVWKYFPSGSQKVLFHFFLPRLGFVFRQEEVKLLFPAWDCSPMAQRVGLRRRDMRSTASLISTYTCFPTACISETANHEHSTVLEKVNFKATAPVLRLGRGRDRLNATMPYTPCVKKPRLPPDRWHETASAQSPGQPRMKGTREGKLKSIQV